MFEWVASRVCERVCGLTSCADSSGGSFGIAFVYVTLDHFLGRVDEKVCE